MIFLQICTLLALLSHNFLIIAHNLLSRGRQMLLASSTVLCLPVYIVTSNTYIVLFVSGVVAIGKRLNLFSPSSNIACPRTSNTLRFPVLHTPISICVQLCARVAAFSAKRFLGAIIPVPHVIFSIQFLMFSVVLLCLVDIFLRSCSTLSLCPCLLFVANRPLVRALSIRFLVYFAGGARYFFGAFVYRYLRSVLGGACMFYLVIVLVPRQYLHSGTHWRILRSSFVYRFLLLFVP